MKTILIFLITTVSFLSLSQYENSFIPFKKSQKWGFSDVNGILKIKPVYDSVNFFYYDKLARVYKGNLCGMIDLTGTTIIPIEFSTCERLVKTYFKVQKGGKTGVINNSKNYVVSLSYELIELLDDNFLLVKSKGKYGVVDIISGKGEMKIKTEYDTIIYHNYLKRFICDKNGMHNIFDYKGNLIEQRKIVKEKQIAELEGVEKVESVSSGYEEKIVSELSTYPRYQTIISNQKKGLIIKTMDGFTHEVKVDTIKPLYDSINPLHWFNNCFIVENDGKWGAINFEGKVIIDIKYDEIDISSMQFQALKPYQQIFTVRVGNKWGAIGNNSDFGESNYPNEIIVPCEYDEVSNKWARTCLVLKSNDKYGLLLKSPNRLEMIGPTPMKYSSIISVRSSFGELSLILVTDTEGNTFYVGQNGVEFFEK